MIYFWLVLFTSICFETQPAKAATTKEFTGKQNQPQNISTRLHNHNDSNDIKYSEPTPSIPLHTINDPDDKNITRNFVSATLGDNMVLQRNKPAVLWGYSIPGAHIVVALLKPLRKNIQQQLDNDVDDANTTNEDTLLQLLQRITTVNNDGLWRVQLPPRPASMIPHTIQVTSITTGQNIALQNILFGDVYICGGQSNMEFSMGGQVNGSQIVEEATERYQHIRVVTIGCYTQSDVPLPDLQKIEKTWSLPNEESMKREGPFGRFSAVCWFFGKEISDALDNKVPLGLINNNVGGSKIEPWQENGRMFNAQIYPYMVGPMAMTGFTWYQGEANTLDQASADQYAVDFRSLIHTWRNSFQIPNAYFGFVQLSTWCPGRNPVAVAEIRHAQMKVVPSSSDDFNNTIGYATAADLGAGCNIHPPEKRVVGRRLGRSALALHYGHTDIHWRSPTYAKATPILRSAGMNDNVAVTIEFYNVGEQGLYLLENPYNNRLNPEDFNCTGHTAGTCAWSSLLLNGVGWVDAKLDLLHGNKIMMTPLLATARSSNKEDDPRRHHHHHYQTSDATTVLATKYGWGSVPMMQIYDIATDLPVLPWNERIHTMHL